MNSRKTPTQSALETMQAQCSGIAAPVSDESEQYWEKEHAARATYTKAQVGAALAVLRPTTVALVDQLQAQISTAMEAQGFWGFGQDSIGQKIALIHSELSEALEADRKKIDADDKIPEFTGLEAELADTIIRILDLSGRLNLRLGEAIIAKMHFNLTRPHKHGKAY